MTVNGKYGGAPNYQLSTLKGVAYVDKADKVLQLDLNNAYKGIFGYSLEDVDLYNQINYLIE